MATIQARSPVQEKVIDYLQDAHAMEQQVLRALESMISTTTDPEVLGRLKRHRIDTERHERILRERLEQLGSSPSLTAEVPAIMSAWLKSLGDKLRSDKPGKNARDGFVTEHVEIAAYELLQRLAQRAGDQETARIARDILDDEREMAHWIAARWDKFIDLTLAETGVELQTGAWPDMGGRHDGMMRGLAPMLWAVGACVGSYYLFRMFSQSRETAPFPGPIQEPPRPPASVMPRPAVEPTPVAPTGV